MRSRKQDKEQSRYWKYFDESWKNIIESLFPHFLRFFVPKLYFDTDWTKKVYFLDKEMKQLSKSSKSGAKYVDKLVKICLKNGEEQWLLIHIEVQGYSDKSFPQRMFRYYYRIFDKYDEKIVSVALLTGSASDPSQGRFESEAYESGVVFRYLSKRLMDYDKSELEKDDNPIALAVLACQERELAKQKGELYNAKRRIIRYMYERGYNKEEIIALFDFIDWVLQLSEEEENLIMEEIREIEGEKNMPYINSIKRLAIKEGKREGKIEGRIEGRIEGKIEGMREAIIEILDERFGNIAQEASSVINQIDDIDKLKFLNRVALRCKSLNEFLESITKREN